MLTADEIKEAELRFREAEESRIAWLGADTYAKQE